MLRLSNSGFSKYYSLILPGVEYSRLGTQFYQDISTEIYYPIAEQNKANKPLNLPPVELSYPMWTTIPMAP